MPLIVIAVVVKKKFPIYSLKNGNTYIIKLRCMILGASVFKF